MSGFMNVLGLGRAAQDPDIKYFDSGTVKASVDVVYSNQYTTKAGEKKEDVYFIKCCAWGKTAEIIGNYIKKGDLFNLEGSLITESWEDKTTGKNRSRMMVNISRVHLLPNNRNNTEENNSHQETQGNILEQNYQTQVQNQVIPTPQKEQIKPQDLEDIPF